MRKLILTLVGLLVLAGCAGSTGSAETPAPKLEELGPAPELTNTTWLNTEAPLRLANLRGKVILLEMWTFG
jgi:hypothetical protein